MHPTKNQNKGYIMNNKFKIVISGYYGHGNFGDEAILKVTLSELKNTFDNPEIKVLSKIPDLKAIAECDLFISGGGSLLQDVTSIRSLLYYLGLLYFAIYLKKKTMIYAQGIGPVKTKPGKYLLKNILKKVDLITVRDEQSARLLKAMGINSEITADPVWAMDYYPLNRHRDKINVGIQLRKWPSLNKNKLKALAKSIESIFKSHDVVINLISLQDKSDIAVLNSFKERLDGFEVNILSGLTTDEALDCLTGMDYLIAMRLHACLVATKYSVPFLAIAYDPKVKHLAKEASAPYVSVRDMNFNMLSNAIKYLINEKDKVKANLHQVALEKQEKALMSPFLKRFFKPDSECDHRKTGKEKVNTQ